MKRSTPTPVMRGEEMNPQSRKVTAKASVAGHEVGWGSGSGWSGIQPSW